MTKWTEKKIILCRACGSTGYVKQEGLLADKLVECPDCNGTGRRIFRSFQEIVPYSKEEFDA